MKHKVLNESKFSDEEIVEGRRLLTQAKKKYSSYTEVLRTCNTEEHNEEVESNKTRIDVAVHENEQLYPALGKSFAQQVLSLRCKRRKDTATSTRSVTTSIYGPSGH